MMRFGIQAARHRNHVAQRVVGMRVIHHHHERLPFVDAFEPPRHRPQSSRSLAPPSPAQCRNESPAPHAARMLYTLIFPSSGDSTAKRSLAELHVEAQPLKARRDVPRAQVRFRSQAVPENLRPGMQLDFASVRIVAVEHGEFRRRTAGSGEEPLFGGKVRFHGAVIVQVIAGQIGEHHGVKLHAVYASQVECVRGNFHGNVRTARLLEIAEEAHQIERFRVVFDSRKHAAGDMILDGPDHGGGLAGGAQYRIGQIGGGGFSVRARNTGQPQPLVGPPIEIARGQRQGLPSVINLNPSRGQIFGRRRLGHHRERALRQCVLRKPAAIGVRAGKREKQIAGIHVARVVLDSAHLRCGKLRRQRLFEPFAREYLA